MTHRWLRSWNPQAAAHHQSSPVDGAVHGSKLGKPNLVLRRDRGKGVAWLHDVNPFTGANHRRRRSGRLRPLERRTPPEQESSDKQPTRSRQLLCRPLQVDPHFAPSHREGENSRGHRGSLAIHRQTPPNWLRMAPIPGRSKSERCQTGILAIEGCSERLRNR